MPLWQYKVQGPSNSINTYGQTETYTGSIVGRSPFTSELGTTKIPVILVPVKLTFPSQPPAILGGPPIPAAVFDPTAVSCVANRTPVDIAERSPLFNDADYTVNDDYIGHTQYIDAFQRANFWRIVKGSAYHLLLELRTLPVVTVHVPSGKGSAFQYDGGCYNGHSLSFGSVRMSWLDSYIRTTLLPSLADRGVEPGVLPVFYLDTIGLSLDSPQYADSLSYSYHGGLKTEKGTQFYAVATFNAGGTTPPSSGVPAPDQPLTDELVTWIGNPLSSNQTPAWGWVGETLGCYGTYAPSWPLSLFSTYESKLNGFTYTTTELAFFSWFFDQSPPMAAGGLYSDHGLLTSPASAQGCTFVDGY
jgi:hypothetical protein